MEAKWREQVVSLIAAANNHGDLAVKLSSLRQLKQLLSSSSTLLPSFASQLYPSFFLLLSSPHPLVRKLLLQVLEEVGLTAMEHSSPLIPAILPLLKDTHPDVSNQAIITALNFFSAFLQQFHRHAKVERWTEEIWMQMIQFKDTVLSLVFEPVSVGTRLLALKYLECFVLQFTPDAVDYDRHTAGGVERRFNISWLAHGHPVLDVARVISEANKLFTSLVGMLHSPNSIPGPLTIAVVN